MLRSLYRTVASSPVAPLIYVAQRVVEAPRVGLLSCRMDCVSPLAFSLYQAIAWSSPYRGVVVPARQAYSHCASVGRVKSNPSLLVERIQERLRVLPRNAFDRPISAFEAGWVLTDDRLVQTLGAWRIRHPECVRQASLRVEDPRRSYLPSSSAGEPIKNVPAGINRNRITTKSADLRGGEMTTSACVPKRSVPTSLAHSGRWMGSVRVMMFGASDSRRGPGTAPLGLRPSLGSACSFWPSGPPGAAGPRTKRKPRTSRRSDGSYAVPERRAAVPRGDEPRTASDHPASRPR